MQAEKLNGLKRTEVVTINVGSNITNSYNFGQLPNIRAAEYIRRIECYNADQVSFTPDNKAVISAAVMKKSYLKLVELGGSNAEIHVYPLWDINQSSENVNVKDINCQAIDWEKSGVYIAEITGLTANQSFTFKIEYQKKK